MPASGDILGFFIRRPVFSSVCSLLIILAGLVCIPTLPVAQYPNLAPPEVSVNAAYLGASAQAVEAAVTIPLEQQINGAEGMRYMTSVSGSDGSSVINLTFDVDRDIDIAAVDVQNRVSTALGRLPREVNATGVSVFKNSPAMILVAGFYADRGELSDLFISNYVDVYLRDALKRVRGVGQVIIFGERKYAMRLWLDPVRLASRGLAAADVVRALRDQNLQVAAGQVGQPPASAEQPYQLSVRAMGRLSEVSDFERIVLKTNEKGESVLMKDVATVELGAEDYGTRLRFNGRDAVGVAVFQLANANALAVDKNVRAELARLEKGFPPGLKYTIAFDPTTAVGESIFEVLMTLGIAILLVIAVIFFFLQDFRSTLIPAVTIPVSLIGTFIFIKIFGFSINTLTLFGITLATGLVVDDAIVVIENIERHMRERKHQAAEVAHGSMKEVASAVVATSLVLIAVFVPVAFFPGTTGRLYKQFSLTIAFSIAISAFNALTLAPALSGLLLRHREGNRRLWGILDVNGALSWLNAAYTRSLRAALRRRWLLAVAFVCLLGLTVFAYKTVPAGFIPTEDQNYFLVMIQAPEGASLSHTSEVMRKVEHILSQDPDVSDVFAVAGWNFGGNASNRAMLFPNLRPLSLRRGKEHSTEAVVNRMRQALSEIPGARCFAFPPPAVQGVSSVGGFSLQLLDQNNNTPAALAKIAEEFVAEANGRKEVAGLFTPFTANDPQIVLQIDREKAKSLGVQVTDIAETLQIYMGSQYVNDFDFNARSYRVYVQADKKFRATPEDLGRYYVRSDRGAMVPLSGLIRKSYGTAPPLINHYNLFRSVEISGEASPGYSSGQAILALEDVARKVLPQGVSFEWSGLSWEEIRAGNQSLIIFAIGLLFVYLVLSAQYESFALPLIILLAVPVALLGGLALQKLRGLSNDVFCQIGLVMLVGLASKNAILIIEFAEQLRAQGMSLVEATIEASRIRLRPILMTSLAFILGLLPLCFATGAGQESRHSLGTPVLGGMVVSTILNLYFIPVLYILAERFRARKIAGAGPGLVLFVMLPILLFSRSALATPTSATALVSLPPPNSLLAARESVNPSVFAPEPLTFEKSLALALSRNVSVRLAEAEVRRVASLLIQIRANALPTLAATGTFTRIDDDRRIGDQVFVPANQLSANLALTLPIVAPMRWADWARAAGDREVARSAAAATKRQVAVAAARAYLAVLSAQRVIESNERARDMAFAHYGFAYTRLGGGVGSELDAVRALETLRENEGRVLGARAALFLAQGTLGAILGLDHPADAAAAPEFPVDTVLEQMNPSEELFVQRADLRALKTKRLVAERVLRNRYADYLPSLLGVLMPMYQNPSSLVQPAWSWQFQLQLQVPIFDGGLRYGLSRMRAALVDAASSDLEGARLQARAELSAVRAALIHTEHALAEARQAAGLARRAVEIAELSYRLGATTNLELLDAQRRYRDAESAAVLAEDEVRRTRLEFLAASGKFP